jgi:DNA sulfur modification protein DndD
MNIKRIQIENFLCFYNHIDIDFSKGMNIVLGLGGKGKSSLFNAFYWALFGKIGITGSKGLFDTDFPDTEKLPKHGFINKRKLFEHKDVNDKFITKVILDIEHDQIYTITRTVNVTRIAEGNWDNPESWKIYKSNLQIQYESRLGSEFLEESDAVYKLKEIFPEGIRDYIWFQGEAIDDLLTFSNKKTFEKAIKHISYFPYYEKLAKVIEKATDVISDKRNKANSANIRQRSLYEKNWKIVQDNTIELNRKSDQILDKETKSYQLVLKNEEIRKKLEGLSGYEGLAVQETQLTNKINSIKSEIESLDIYQKESFKNLWLLKGISTLIEDGKSKINSYEDTKLENEPLMQKFIEHPTRDKLEKIKSEGVCYVCGSPVIIGNKAYDHIMSRIEAQDTYYKEMEQFKTYMEESKQFSIILGKVSEYPDEVSRKIVSIDQNISESEGKIGEYMIERNKKLQELNDVKDKIDELNKQLGIKYNIGVEQAKGFNNNIKFNDIEIKRFEKEVQDLKKQKTELINEKNSAQAILDKITSGEGHNVPEDEWFKISSFIKEIVETAKENARLELIKTIEKKANEFYRDVTQHSTSPAGAIKIYNDYTIAPTIPVSNSYYARMQMSIINAMISLNQKARNVYFPFIADAPTSSLDPESTFAYTKGIIDTFEQTIIITKDIDKDSDYFTKLFENEKVKKIFELKTVTERIKGEQTEPNEAYTKVELIK